MKYGFGCRPICKSVVMALTRNVVHLHNIGSGNQLLQFGHAQAIQTFQLPLGHFRLLLLLLLSNRTRRFTTRRRISIAATQSTTFTLHKCTISAGRKDLGTSIRIRYQVQIFERSGAGLFSLLSKLDNPETKNCVISIIIISILSSRCGSL